MLECGCEQETLHGKALTSQNEREDSSGNQRTGALPAQHQRRNNQNLIVGRERTERVGH